MSQTGSKRFGSGDAKEALGYLRDRESSRVVVFKDKVLPALDIINHYNAALEPNSTGWNTGEEIKKLGPEVLAMFLLSWMQARHAPERMAAAITRTHPDDRRHAAHYIQGVLIDARARWYAVPANQDLTGAVKSFEETAPAVAAVPAANGQPEVPARAARMGEVYIRATPMQRAELDQLNENGWRRTNGRASLCRPCTPRAAWSTRCRPWSSAPSGWR